MRRNMAGTFGLPLIIEIFPQHVRAIRGFGKPLRAGNLCSFISYRIEILIKEFMDY
jgi:hypothetical protein